MPRCMCAPHLLWLFPCQIVRDHVAGFVLVRPQDHLPGGVAELIDVMSGYVLKLRRELTRFRPFAVRSKTDFAQDGVERIGVHVVGKLVVIEALGALDRLSQYLSGRIAERDEVVADRIDLKDRKSVV